LTTCLKLIIADKPTNKHGQFRGMRFIKTENKEYKEVADEELIRLILNEGRKDLLEIIYDRYVGKVYYKSSALVSDRELGKDLTHDIMVKILLNLSKFSGKSAFGLWVNSITYNFCMDYLRKQKRQKTNSVEGEYFATVESDNSELEYKTLKEMRLNQLEELFKQLKPEEKMVMIMRYKDGMSIRNIAEALDTKEGTIKMRLKRSRDRLGKLLKTSNYEE